MTNRSFSPGTPTATGAGAAGGRPRRARGGQAGQTMPLVLGIVLILSLGTVVLVQNTFEQFPIVTKDVIQHEAYRAMESGLNEFLYAVNANADVAACNATFVDGGTTSTSSLTSASSICSALSYGSWTSVPGSGSSNGPPAFFLIDNPRIDVTSGHMSIDIVGAAGYANDYNYQSAVLTLQPLNSFLLNVLWINYDQTDPAVVSQYDNVSTPSCTYYWSRSPDALGNNCQSISFITGDALTGNLFINDTVFVCGSPSFDNVQTADPAQTWYEPGITTLSSALVKNTSYTSIRIVAMNSAVGNGDTLQIGTGATTQTVTASANASAGSTTVSVSRFTANANYGTGAQVQDTSTCSGTPTASGTATDNVAAQDIPTDNSSLGDEAQLDGCYYQGPTTIVLNGSTMNVTSPATPTGKPSGASGSSSSNDALNDAANTANVCMPSSSGGSVAVPANGVIFVDNCGASYTTTTYSRFGGSTTYCNGQTYNPLSSAGETGVGGDTIGDAIVQGTISSPMTIGSANNIVIDGNLCYADTMSSGNCTTTAPAVPSTDVLGLVALNYVEVNHPVTSHGANQSSCSPANSPTSGAVTCDLSSPIIDAVILALNHSFLVNNFTSGSSLGTLNVFGTIDQDWRGPVGTFGSGGTIATGYAKNYQYDSRLVFLSPPYYLNPGTSQWGLASFTVAAGSCTTPSGAYPSACTGYP